MNGLVDPQMVGGSPRRALEHPCVAIPEREREQQDLQREVGMGCGFCRARMVLGCSG